MHKGPIGNAQGKLDKEQMLTERENQIQCSLLLEQFVSNILYDSMRNRI